MSELRQTKGPLGWRGPRVHGATDTVAAAMLDRLLHRSVVFNINGESYRMRAHRARAEATRRALTP